MVSWQAFPSLLPRAPLAFLSQLKLFFPKLPFPSLANACHAGYTTNGFLFFLLNYRRTSRYGHLSNTDTYIMDSFQCLEKILIYFL